MEGGSGKSSYARNSSLQASLFASLAPILGQAIACHLDVKLQPRDLVTVADLGCGTGNNTIDATSLVVKEIENKFKDLNLEFKVCFNDLQSNDFNTLFSSLCNQEDSLRFFVSAVPGSFYKRLFPTSSIHLAMSNAALHWLSKLPEEAFLNEDRIWIDKFAKPQVVEAYARQAHDDLCDFFRFRAQEIVGGGLLSLLMHGRSNTEPSKQTEGDTNFTDWIVGCGQLAWEDMVAQKLVDKESFASFNLAGYHRHCNELTKAVEETGNQFNILKVELIQFEVPSYARAKVSGVTPQEYAAKETLLVKSLLKPTVDKHLQNPSLVDELFKRLEDKLLPTETSPLRYAPMLLAILQRKS